MQTLVRNVLMEICNYLYSNDFEQTEENPVKYSKSVNEVYFSLTKHKMVHSSNTSRNNENEWFS